MENVIDMEAIKKMPIEKRRQIIDSIEESIEVDLKEGIDEEYALETDEELQVLSERLEEYKKNPGEFIPWDNLKNEALR